MIYDVAVVGGGIVGLATTRELLCVTRASRRQRRKGARLRAHQTGRNSGVIHSGDLLQARLAQGEAVRRGPATPGGYCESKGIPYKRVGKLIVATEEARARPSVRLSGNAASATASKGSRCSMRAESASASRTARGIRAISSPVTGIVDYARVAQRIADDAREAGAEMFSSAKSPRSRAAADVDRAAHAGRRDPGALRHHVRRTLRRQARAR